MPKIGNERQSSSSKRRYMFFHRSAHMSNRIHTSQTPVSASDSAAADDGDEADDFDCHRKQLVSGMVSNEGWQAELARYLSDILEDVTKDTDIVVWWGVRTSPWPESSTHDLH
jgi:hypothetical protein